MSGADKQPPSWALAWILAGMVLLMQTAEIRDNHREIRALRLQQATLEGRQDLVERELDHGIEEMKRATAGLLEGLETFLNERNRTDDGNRENEDSNSQPDPGPPPVHESGHHQLRRAGTGMP